LLLARAERKAHDKEDSEMEQYEVERPEAYEAPALIEVGAFAELTEEGNNIVPEENRSIVF